MLLKANPGLEDVASRECMDEVNCKPVEVRKGRGRLVVDVEGGLEHVYVRSSAMRSIHAVVVLLSSMRVGKDRGALEEVYNVALESGAHRYIPEEAFFAVESQRIGEGHDYTSMDISRVVGQAIIDAARRAGRSIGVRLNSPSVVVYAEVDEDIFSMGILLSGERSMHRRGYRIYDHPAALKPSIAYSMLRLAEASDGDTIMDPMCGGGTVAIEAAHLFEDSKIICIDKNPAYIRGAVENAIAARVASRIEFIVGDSTRLGEYMDPEIVDTAVSNPPYGIRMGDPGMVRRVYKGLAHSLAHVLKPGGRAVLITTESSYMARVAEASGLSLLHARKVRHGDLWASILVLGKGS